ncbi:solute carrier family 22 member 7-like [Nelusetta ayraudi]|uniref:solute carrier family 22 member 7-like n=1 Tax=Nelusetta ayraudi TaxID=303726 RepID=UPI003F72D8E9
MKFDSILSEINGFGKFQIQLFLIQFFSRITLPCHFLLNNFMAAVPSHHCNVTALDDVFWNLTEEQLLVVSVPTEQDGTRSSCRMFLEPQYQILLGRNSSEDAKTFPCQNGWVYDHSTFRSTVVTEWDLVCDRKWMSKATTTIFFVGLMIGAPLFGFLSDRFGRRKVLLASYLSTMFFALLSAFSVSYIMFVIMRFFTGLSIAGISIISSVLNVEWVSTKHRTLSALMMGLDGTVGTWILVGFAYGVNEWRMLILAVTSPLILSVIVWWWLPESARWLLANGKTNDAYDYIMKCAKMNNSEDKVKDLRPETLIQSAKDKTKDGNEKNYTFVDIFRTPNIRKLSIYLGLVWFGAELTYYGISLNIAGFGLSLFLTQFIFASMELPMKIVVFYLLNKLGRKPSEMGALFLTAVFLLINMFIPKDQAIARTSVAVFGKAVSEASCTIMYLYTAELYPTVVRQNGVGYTAFIARLGVSMSPLIMLLEDFWYLLPAVTYSTVAVIAGLVASRLTETLNTNLPETIGDIEKRKGKEKAVSAVSMENVRLASGDT